MLLGGHTSVPAKWYLILSNSYSRVHECDRRHTDRNRDRPRGSICRNRQNCSCFQQRYLKTEQLSKNSACHSLHENHLWPVHDLKVTDQRQNGNHIFLIMGTGECIWSGLQKLTHSSFWSQTGIQGLKLQQDTHTAAYWIILSKRLVFTINTHILVMLCVFRKRNVWVNKISVSCCTRQHFTRACLLAASKSFLSLTSAGVSDSYCLFFASCVPRGFIIDEMLTEFSHETSN